MMTLGAGVQAMGSMQQLSRSLLDVDTLRLLSGNITLRLLAYNLFANAGLYLFYQMTPFSSTLQKINRMVLWNLFWY
jgi:hypothetical protein